jgi:hypothetical protein
MIDCRRELAFSEESGPVFWSAQALMQNLERHPPFLFEVFDFVDFSHASTTEQALNSIGPELVTAFEARRPMGIGRLVGTKVFSVGPRAEDRSSQHTGWTEGFWRLGWKVVAATGTLQWAHTYQKKNPASKVTPTREVRSRRPRSGR